MSTSQLGLIKRLHLHFCALSDVVLAEICVCVCVVVEGVVDKGLVFVVQDLDFILVNKYKTKTFKHENKIWTAIWFVQVYSCLQKCPTEKFYWVNSEL